MWLIGVEVEQGTSAPPPRKNAGSAPDECGKFLPEQLRLIVSKGINKRLKESLVAGIILFIQKATFWGLYCLLPGGA